MSIEIKNVKLVKNVKGSTVAIAAVVAGVLAFGATGAAKSSGPVYAIKGARVFGATGLPVSGATVVIRNGVIEDVGANVTAPADAIVIDAANMNVYPGLIDMESDAPLTAGTAGGGGAQQAAFGGRGGGGGQGGQQFATLEEAERAKREAILRPHFMAAENLVMTNPALGQLASAGVTTVLAVPGQGIFKGHSALVNVAVPPDDPQISTIADYRGGLAVLKSPVALHVNMAGRGGGQGYPGALLGTIAFTRQELLNAQWQRDAHAHYTKTGGRGPRPVLEPALDAVKPALARELPTAFDASAGREIDRALKIASDFGLTPIIVGASEAADRIEELAKAKASVILSVNFPGGRGGGAGGGRGGGGGGASVAQLRAQANAPKVPAALAAAKIPVAFTSGGTAPADFIRNVGRAIKEGGLSPDAALRALTIDAARLAGASDRTGSIEKGKVANIVVTEGDLFDGGRVRHVFIDGRPVEITAAPPAPGGGRGRGGV
jgi:imidazolonepropionase-like amidohydrolase